MKKTGIYTTPSWEMKIFECKLCKHKGERKGVRNHVRENHLWQDSGSLSNKIKSYEFK